MNEPAVPAKKWKVTEWDCETDSTHATRVGWLADSGSPQASSAPTGRRPTTKRMPLRIRPLDDVANHAAVARHQRQLRLAKPRVRLVPGRSPVSGTLARRSSALWYPSMIR